MNEIIQFIQLNPKRILFILGFGVLGFAAVRAWRCDILGFDPLTRKKMTGDDLFPIYLGEPNVMNEHERKQFLLKDKNLKLWIIYPLLAVTSFLSVFFGIMSLDWRP